MKREYGDYVSDILTSIEEVEEFTRGIDFQAFSKDKKTLNAVIRSLEIMGEAAKQVPEAIRARHPDIPWKRIAGMRDKLIHEYAGVDLEIIWGVAKEEIPPLKPRIKKLLQEMEQSESGS